MEGVEGRGVEDMEAREGRVWWQVKSQTWCDNIWQGRIFENGFCKSHHFHKRFHLMREREREKGEGEERSDKREKRKWGGGGGGGGGG